MIKSPLTLPPRASAVVALFSLALCAIPPQVSAQTVYRCVDSSTGKVTFSDTACQGNSEGERVDVRANTLDTSGSREQALRREIQELREELREQRQESAVPQYGRTQPDLQAERIDMRACDQARRAYEVATSSRSTSKDAVEAKRSAMYGACGMKEPTVVKTENHYHRSRRDDDDKRRCRPDDPDDFDCVSRRSGRVCKYPGDPSCE